MLLYEHAMQETDVHQKFLTSVSYFFKKQTTERTMADNQSFPDHVWMYESMTSRPSVLVDVAIGTFTSGIAIIAIIGNSLAL